MKIHCRTKDSTTPPQVLEDTLTETIHKILALRQQLANKVEKPKL